jgi:3-hydroxybutyryl-CoA dehydrogenase
MADLAACDLVVEAIVERLDVKQRLFPELEDIVGPEVVLATNTSSLSVTAIGAALKRPSRLAGYHFFNPVPLMRVVEVIAGPQDGSEGVPEAGRLQPPVWSYPCIGTRHAGLYRQPRRPGLWHRGPAGGWRAVADFATIDRILKDQMGFRLGPFELMDLTALDVSHPVMESIYRQYYDEPRYRPSVITAQRLAGGVVGKKVGDGLLCLRRTAWPKCPGAPRASGGHAAAGLGVAQGGPAQELYQLLKDLGAEH